MDSPAEARQRKFRFANVKPMTQGGFLEEEGFFSEEPEPWRPPVRCPHCDGAQTHFVTMRYEMSVYECEACGLQFEADEEGS